MQSGRAPPELSDMAIIKEILTYYHGDVKNKLSAHRRKWVENDGGERLNCRRHRQSRRWTGGDTMCYTMEKVRYMGLFL